MESFRKVTCTHCGAINFGEQTQCLECSTLLPIQAQESDDPQLMITAPFPSKTRPKESKTPMDEWQLRVVGGTGVGKVYQLDMRTGVGRTQDNEIPIKDPKISRRHAVIERTMEGWMVTDLDSVNGTYVDGKRIHRRTPLELGMEVHFGDTVLVVEKKR